MRFVVQVINNNILIHKRAHLFNQTLKWHHAICNVLIIRPDILSACDLCVARSHDVNSYSVHLSGFSHDYYVTPVHAH